MNFSVKDIIKIANDNAKLDDITFPPEDMGELEKILYWQIYNLFVLYNKSAIDANFAKIMKNRYITEYGRAELKRDIYNQAHKRRVHINVALGKGIECGCEHCKMAMELLDGKHDSEIEKAMEVQNDNDN